MQSDCFALLEKYDKLLRRTQTSVEEFSELAEIRRTNALLTEYYAYLESLWPEATVLRPTKDPFYFTDRRYEYGAIPSHINEIFNQSLAEEIQLRLSDGKEETDNG